MPSQWHSLNRPPLWKFLSSEALQTIPLGAFDGSGEGSADPRTRRAAFVAVRFGAQADCPGKMQIEEASIGRANGRQSVPRAELSGLVQVCSMKGLPADSTVIGDAKYVINIFED